MTPCGVVPATTRFWGGDAGGTGDGNADVFAFEAGNGDDTIADFEQGFDTIGLNGYTFDDVALSDDGHGGTLVEATDSGFTVDVYGVNLTQDDFTIL